MSELRTLQREFLAFLLDGDPAIAAKVVDQAPVGRDTRLAIYGNAYRLRLRETLETDHEMLGLYLGDELWDQLSDGYIKDQPSTFRSLRQYGDALPAWLRDHAPFRDFPQIAEFADFERRLLVSFDAADTERVSDTALAAIPADHWPGLKLRFHPSVQRFPATTNCVPIWQALKAGKTPPAPNIRYRGEIEDTWLLWRGEDRLTQFRSMSEHEIMVLHHFLGGGDFAGACERLALLVDEDAVAPLALELLTEWLRAGLIRELISGS